MMELRADVFNEDCISGMRTRLEPGSVTCTISSIPFEELFTYSGKIEDVGNNGSTVDIRSGRFALNMRFVIDSLFEVHAPGTVACIHIQQLLAHCNQHGFMGRRDFRGAVIDLFREGGWIYAGEAVVPKDPQAMAQRLNLHSLQFKTGYARSSTKWAPAPCDFVLIFAKPGDVAVPVRPLKHKTNPTGWLTNDDWIHWAKGTWEDIDQFDIIDGARSRKALNDLRESENEKHVCLARDTLVLTRAGYVPIQDVSVGDEVLTHRGRWRPVLAKVCNGRKQVVRTEAQGVPGLLTTQDHLLYVRKGVGFGRWPGRPGGTSSPRSCARSATPEWMRADETKGHYVNLRLPPVESSPYSAHEWWIVGRWLGDGHFDVRDRAHISCGHKEMESLASSLGARAGAVTKRRTGHQIAINDCGGRLRALLARCGRGAAGKRLPAEAIALDKEKAEALLSGYMSADGHYVARYDRWTASSVSRPLLLGMAMVAQRARGVVASVYAGRPSGETTIEGRLVHTKQDWILSVPPRNVSAMMLDDGAWKKVRQVRPAEDAEVWDLQVEEDASFTAEGCIVHNCPLQLTIIRRCVLLYSNPVSIDPNSLVLDPFMGVGSTAHVCIEQGRHSVGFELKESYHAGALANIKKAREDRGKVERQGMLPWKEGAAE